MSIPSTNTGTHATASAAGLLPGEQRLVPNRQLPAWLLSFLLHTILFTTIFLALRSIPNGAAEIDAREAGIVLVNADSQKTEYLTEGEIEDDTSATTSAASPPPLTADQQLPPDLPGFDATQTLITGVGEELVQSLPGADGLLDGVPNNRNIGGKVTTEVFGIKGTGSRFVYVFDRSASMSGYNNKPLKAAKQQLLASLESLGPTQQFQIIFYNDTTMVFDPNPGPPEMMPADDQTKRQAIRFVERTQADRGTDHLNALRLALSLAPDVIFLLTDAEGGFTRGELGRVSDWNRSGAIINAIEFGVGSSRGNDRSLEQLAREHGGTYIYKNILTLRD